MKLSPIDEIVPRAGGLLAYATLGMLLYGIWRGLFVWQPEAAYWCLITGMLPALQVMVRVFKARQK
jgi:hypothetical protein